MGSDQRGVRLTQIVWIVSAYGIAWGMWLCGGGIDLMPLVDSTIWPVAGAMVLSGLAVRLFAEETLPRLNPAQEQGPAI